MEAIACELLFSLMDNLKLVFMALFLASASKLLTILSAFASVWATAV